MSDLIEQLEQRAEELAGVDMALDAANSKDIALLHEAAAALDATTARLREAEGLLKLSRAALDPFGSKEFLARLDTFLKGAEQ